MEKTTRIAEVSTSQTQRGNTRYSVRDADGAEYTTFRPGIGEQARQLEGQRARLEFHEEQRGNFTNVYLDGVAPAGEEEATGGGGSGDGDTDPAEVAWRTAVDAAPWILGSNEPQKAVDPEELFDRLKPFKDRVSEDIREESES
jgi:hypothetical protein